MNLPPLGEFDLIRRIKAMASHVNTGVELGIGDDCAILRPSADPLLVTTDLLMDGRHFVLADCGPDAAGYKAMGVNLSDIAAMAGRPIAAFVAVALPRDGTRETAIGLMRGLAEMATRHGVQLAGGDTNAWNGPLVVGVTVIGAAHAKGPVPRSGAMVGDAIFVTGPLGGSILGRHLRPVPRVLEAQTLHSRLHLHAMIDLSDGLASDLRHILDASGGLGATLDAQAIPIHHDARLLAQRDGRSAIDHALGDGEDFELCFTVAETDADPPRDDPAVRRVGTVESTPGLRLRLADGQIATLDQRGFDHLRTRDDHDP